MKLYEMEGFLRGKCVPGDLLVNETNAQYLVRKFTELNDRIEVTTAALREKTKQCEQLAAENAKLADCANFYRLGFKPVRGNFGIEYRPTEQLLDDCGNTALEAIQTPATDAFLREVRASAVDAVCLTISNSIVSCRQDEMIGLDEAVNIASDFAAQLRNEVKG